MHFRSYFASVCLLSITAEAKNRADYSLERTLLERAHAKEELNVHPDKVPNWMRGFYDDFHEKTPDYHEQPDHDSRQHSEEYEPAGFGQDLLTDLVRDDPYQRQKSHHKSTAQPHELERHQRGAFRDEADSSHFTMHPKKAEYQSEVDLRRL